MFRGHTFTRIIVAIILGSSLYTNVSIARVHFKGSVAYGNNEPFMDEVGKIGLVIGAAGLATYGLVKLGSWLFSKTDKTATEEAQQAIREVSAQYKCITAILDDAYANCIDSQSCINNISEPVLYAIAKAKYHDTDIEPYLRQFATALKKIDNHAKSLHDRITVAQSQPDQDYETLKLIAHMKALKNQIKELLPTLTFAYDYLKHHESYFILFQIEDSMAYRYERDLHAVESYHGDIIYLRDMIHQSVMIYQRRHHDPYPYRWYLERLEEDIHAMYIAMNKVSYEYTNRFNVASTLCNKLEFIRETLIGSPYYADELRAYEYAKIAQTAIDAQQLQAYTQGQQAYELQRENDLREQELREATNQCCCNHWN